MTYQEAQTAAAKFGAKRCRFTAPKDGQLASRQGEVTQCWIDRIEMLQMAADRGGPLGDLIADANRYA
jgi:hypothetical protein